MVATGLLVAAPSPAEGLGWREGICETRGRWRDNRGGFVVAKDQAREHACKYDHCPKDV